MKQIEENIINSFRLAKSDIIKLQNNLNDFRKAHEALMKRVSKLEVDNAKLEKMVEANKKAIPKAKKEEPKIIIKRTNGKKTHYIASKSGKRFHLETCPFGINIKPKSKVSFKSKVSALNEGYKPCACIK